MKREEILEKSRNENIQEDEREKQLRQNPLPALLAFCMVFIILMIAELAFLDTEIITSSLAVALCSMLFVQNWYQLVVIKKKYLIATSVLWTLGFIMSILRFITAFQKMM